ncbi:hypothetical protein [Paenibacillus sp. L3-i20]|uniref:hypothetical protein n=1 Tax=Paenibacillus sp. L3-i20 TaxID=2905833 RepID=UPI001EE0BE62|nr:hypothetical protein [Paenibacillus sp. L3-i20]GKU80322.1 hypothetical protein L3i20_v247190 [Paenibacillus sp. L3-i20]
MSISTINDENDYHSHKAGGCKIIINHSVKKKVDSYEKRNFSWLLLILTFILLTGCGTSSSGNKETASGNVAQGKSSSNEKGDPFADIAPADITDMPTALNDMSSLIKSFKIAVESDDKEEAVRQGDSMAAIWKAIREEVARNQAERHDQINKDLSELLKVVKEKELDKTLLVDLDYSLYQGLREVKQAFTN